MAAKRALKGWGFQLLAGQPPSGCDHLPVVEVKDPERIGIGSKGAYKPDLIAHRAGVFLIVECKPEHDDGDAEKLRGILASPARLKLLYEEIRLRRIFDRHKVITDADHFQARLRGCLAHAGAVRPIDDLYVIHTGVESDEAVLLAPLHQSEADANAFDDIR